MNEKVLEGCHKDESTDSFLENLKKAAFLYVDLHKLEQTTPKDEKRNLKWATYYMMMEAACLQMNVPIEGYEEAYRRVDTEATNLNTFLRSILNIPASLYLVLAFDEIGALEAKANKYDFDIHPFVGVQPHSDFFGIIRELCQQDNLFFLVVGKSNGLNIRNNYSSVSSVLLEFIPLSPLDSPSIKEPLEKSSTRLPNRPLVSEFLCNTSLRVEALADALLEYSGGVPGLLTRTVNILLNHVRERKEPLSKEKCIELMENDKFEEFYTRSFQNRVSFLEENMKKSFDMLLMMALYHIPFTLQSKLPSKVPVFDVATEMGFYRRSLKWNTYGVLIAKVSISYFENLFDVFCLEKLLLGTLRTEPIDCFYYSKFRLFEGLVAMQLHRILSLGGANDH
eukprot:jgi/Galph1/3405/GphlegSOOS_G2110.1